VRCPPPAPRGPSTARGSAPVVGKRTGTMLRALLPAAPCISLPSGPGLFWRRGEDPGDTGRVVASAVSWVAPKVAGPTELWGVGYEESILGNGMFQSRGGMSKWLMDTGRPPRGAGPRSQVTVLVGYHHTLWTLVRAPWRSQAARAGDPLGCRGIAAGRGARALVSVCSGPPHWGAAASRVCRHRAPPALPLGAPRPYLAVFSKPACAPGDPVYGETEALGGCGTPPPPAPAVLPWEPQGLPACSGPLWTVLPKSPHSMHSDSSLP